LSSESALTKMSRESAARLLSEAGFADIGFARLERPFSIALYQEWLGKGYQADMNYLDRHFVEKENPRLLMKRASSAIVVLKNYVPHPAELSDFPLKEKSLVASYARGRDYHHFLKTALAGVIDQLKALAPGEEFLSFTDSSPVLERDLAARAGLGWIGKNTCLISRQKGSLFFIAEIYTSFDFMSASEAETKLSPDHCGTCRRCVDACPTGALVGPRELDARRCISYLTIESREIPPEELRAKMGSWLFGCDICQNVCPWNRKLVTDKEARGSLERAALIEDLKFLLGSSHRAIERAFHGTPLARAGGLGLKRNALVVAANLKVKEVVAEIEALRTHERLGELARWALKALFDARETGH